MGCSCCCCSSSSVGKQSQLLLKPTEVELGLQVGVKFDNRKSLHPNICSKNAEIGENFLSLKCVGLDDILLLKQINFSDIAGIESYRS